MNAPPPPPWRSRAFASIVAPAGFDDLKARGLFLDALVAADALPTVEASAEALGVSKRTLQRARDWLQGYDPDAFALLRRREPGAVALGGAGLAARRWGARKDSDG